MVLTTDRIFAENPQRKDTYGEIEYVIRKFMFHSKKKGCRWFFSSDQPFIIVGIQKVLIHFSNKQIRIESEKWNKVPLMNLHCN